MTKYFKENDINLFFDMFVELFPDYNHQIKTSAMFKIMERCDRYFIARGEIPGSMFRQIVGHSLDMFPIHNDVYYVEDEYLQDHDLELLEKIITVLIKIRTQKFRSGCLLKRG